jgi:hypothetical protein
VHVERKKKQRERKEAHTLSSSLEYVDRHGRLINELTQLRLYRLMYYFHHCRWLQYFSVELTAVSRAF